MAETSGGLVWDATSRFPTAIQEHSLSNALQPAPEQTSKEAPKSVLDVSDRILVRAWRIFKSLQFGIFLLSLIALASIWGTMRYASNPELGGHQIPLAKAKVFNAPWFGALLGLFAVQLMVSTSHVTRLAFTIWGARSFRRSRASYAPDGNSPRAEVPVSDDLPKDFDAAIRRRFTRTHRDGEYLFAHRGLLSRVGPTIVHAGMLIVLGVGMLRVGLVRSGYIISEGQFIAAENETVNFFYEPVDLSQKLGGDNVRLVEIPENLMVRVLDFDEIKHPNVEAPAYFSSLIEVTDPHTGTVEVFQLDMNHSVNLRGLQFHQSGYQPVEDSSPRRFNFDVRSRASGNRIAVTDAFTNVPVRIGDTNLHLLVDDPRPGGKWEIFDRSNPLEARARGIIEGPLRGDFSYEVTTFFPDLQVDPDTGAPFNAGMEPRNPAVLIATFLDGKTLTPELTFLHEETASEMPSVNGRYKFHLRDVHEADGVSREDWDKPGSLLFTIAVLDVETGEQVREDKLLLKDRSPALHYERESSPTTGTEGDFSVINLGPEQRFITVLSVVREPTTGFTSLGVAVIVIGALMTFAFRYESLYAWHDRGAGLLRVALIPRWGRSNGAARESLARLLQEWKTLYGMEGTILDAPATNRAADAEDSLSAPQALTKV